MNGDAKKLWRDPYALILVAVALVLNGTFLCLNLTKYRTPGIINQHGQIGYNFAKYNQLKLNTKLSKYMRAKRKELGRVIEYSEVNHLEFGTPDVHRSVHDTIGYGLFLGILWKITGSYRYLDARLIQILIFCLLMFLIYGLALMWFKSRRSAFLVGCIHLSFLPIFYENVNPQRDIWAYYALVLLLYGVSSFLLKKTSLAQLALWMSLFGICQWMRPMVVFSFIMTGCVLLVYGIVNTSERGRIFKALSVGLICNTLIFWIPFMAYNKQVYNRYIVSPYGQNMLAGMGEFDNPWGFKCSDSWMKEHVSQKYNVKYGTSEFQDKAYEEFMWAYSQSPWHYYRSVLKRIPKLLFPRMHWHDTPKVDREGENEKSGFWNRTRTKVKRMFSSKEFFFDYVFRVFGLLF